MRGWIVVFVFSLLLPAMSAAAAQWQTSLKNAKLGAVGFFRYSHTDSNATKNGFQLKEFKVCLTGTFSEKNTYKAVYSFPKSTLYDAFVKWGDLPVPDAAITFGQHKLPFSLAGLRIGKPAPFEKTIRSVRIYETGANKLNPRDIGVLFSGTLMNKRIGYGAGLYNGATINTDDNDSHKDSFWHLKVSPVEGLSVGGAYWEGMQPSCYRKRYSGFLSYKYGGFDLQAEFIGVDQQTTSNDSYAVIAYRYKDFEPVVRLEMYDPNQHVKHDKTYLYTIGLNYYLSKHHAIKANYNIFEEEVGYVKNDEFLMQLDLKF